MPNSEAISGSPQRTFRDPQGRLYCDGDRFLRDVHAEHAEAVLTWIRSPLAEAWTSQGRMVQTKVLSSAPGGPAQLEHQRVFFPSYPWEWTPGQWKKAAALTLDLCEEALEHGYILKDATPLNILFAGTQPTLVDVLSIERRDPKSSLWLAYGQFVRTFLLPLAAYIHLGWPLAATQLHRDGYEPAKLAPWLSFAERWRKPFRHLVTFPLLLERFLGENASAGRLESRTLDPEVSAAVLRRTLRQARSLLASLVPCDHVSRWSRYTSTSSHYQPEDQDAKQTFVRRVLLEMHPATVLDVGANTGVYARIAAEAGASVVAWDTDVQAAELNWQAGAKDGLNILPLVADFARPTPAMGWDNREHMSLLDRARRRFDCVLMLGVIHHLLIADQIPLEQILGQLASITTRWAVVEWVPKEDAQFVSLLRGREALYAHYTDDFFARAVSPRFVVRAHQKLPNERSLWLLEKPA